MKLVSMHRSIIPQIGTSKARQSDAYLGAMRLSSACAMLARRQVCFNAVRGSKGKVDRYKIAL